MDFNQYQIKARKTAIYPNVNNNLWYPGLGLCGESGEVGEKIKKIYRDYHGIVILEKKVELSKELGDVLWYVSNIASELGLDLNTIAEQNIEKLSKRAAENKVHGEGDDR